MTRPVRIPADVNRPDRVLGPLTARQVVLLAIPASVLYVAWSLLRGLVSPPVFAAIAVPPAALAVAVALGHRDGLPLDRFLLAALDHHLRCRLHRHRLDGAPLDPADRPAAPWAPTNVPPTVPPTRAVRRGTRHERRVSPGPLAAATLAGLGRDPGAAGMLDLGSEGLVAIAALSTINLGLRTPIEQDALVAGFARYLHTITGSVQFLIRTVPLDLSGHLQTLREQARALPHPALVAAADAHRAHLAALTRPPGERASTTPGDDGQDSGHGLLGRQTLLILREHRRLGAEQRLHRRLDDAVGFLAPLDVAVVALSAEQITTLLADWWDPPCAAALRSGHRDAAAAPPDAVPRRSARPATPRRGRGTDRLGRGGDVPTVPDKARPPRRTRSEVATTGGVERDDGLDDGLDDAVGDELHQARPSRHDPRLHVSPTDADPWAQLAALPRHDVRPEIGDDRGRAAVDFSLLDDQVPDLDPDREPVAGGASGRGRACRRGRLHGRG